MGGSLSIVGVRREPSLTFGNPTTVSRPGATGLGPTFRNQDVAPDGKRFVIVVDDVSELGAMPGAQIHVVLNWFEELKRLVPTK